MNTSELETARVKVQAFAVRIKSDKEYARTAQEDPVRALVDAGFSAEAIADFLREEDLADDVSGFALTTHTMTGADCHLTCAITCLQTKSCSMTHDCWFTGL